MWVGALAVLLGVATWVGGYFLEWPLWLKILLTVLLVALVAAWMVGRRVRASLKARGLERELLKQAEQQAMNARPDRRAEIFELHVQMQEGLQALRKSRIANRGGGALYTLPWYMLIGPPGAGKTTALRHSGLVFPFLDPTRAGRVRGVGGTRNCDWWFTNDAILLDTAGRWATEADDRDEWLAFLDMLRKYRSRKPINGVLVAISLTDLMEATDEQIDSYAKRLRARFDEMTTRLQMIVPAYVMFTKADLIAGFVEFWGELSKSERAQMWGMTFPLQYAEGRDPGSAFDEEFDLLVARLHARALKRLGAARQPETRRRVYQFPLEFAALKRNLREFVSALMQPNSFQETPILRGVYFSSGTQEGRPVDRVLGAMRQAFNLAPTPQSLQPSTEAKSYFVTDLFQKVVFPDQLVASRTRRELRRQLVQRSSLAVAACSLGAALVVPSIYSFAQNLSYVGESHEIADRSQNIDWSDGTSFVTKVHRLDDLHARLEELKRWRKDGPPLSMGWGMYGADRLYEALRAVYLSNLQAQFAEPARAQLERDLTSMISLPRLSAEQYATYFDRLRAYLELSDPPRIEPEWEPAAMTEVCSQVLGTATAADKAALKPHVEHYVSLVLSGEAPPWRINASLVNRARSQLKQFSQTDPNYSVLIHEANDNAAPVSRQTILVGSAFQTFMASKSRPEVVVHGAFTRAGWESYIREKLDKGRAKHLAQGRWVLGETQELGIEHVEATLQALRDRYFVDFRNAWADFFRDLEVRQPATNAEALDELTALTENPSPYAKLLNALADNTRLELPPASLLSQTATPIFDKLLDEGRQNQTLQKILGDGGLPEKERPWVSPVRQDFLPMVTFGVPEASGDTVAPTGLSHYLQQIVAKVVGTLTDVRDAQIPPDGRAIDQVFREALRGTSELLSSTQSGFTHPLLAPLLMNPIRNSYRGALSEITGDVDRKWGLDVYQDWHDKLDGHYPFADSAPDVTLADYAEFFKPDKGLLWAFYGANLHDTLERDGDSFTPVSGPNSAKYTPDFVKCYQRGWMITGNTFAEGSDQPAVEFDVNVHSVSESVSEVTFEVDGARGTYKNTPEEWFHVQWPSKDPKKRGASLRVRGFDSLDEQIARPGDFGLFRMLDGAAAIEPGTGGGKPGGGQTVVVKWNLQSQKAWVRMDIRPIRSHSVFSSYLEKHERMFRGYKCPSHLAVGVP